MGSTGANNERANRPLAVLCDFDDTIALQNVAQLLLDRFGHSKWQELRKQLRSGAINFRQYQERSFDAVTATREEMEKHAETEAIVRDGFHEFWQYCQNSGIPVAIASLGLDFYIQTILDREAIGPVPTYAVHTSFTPERIGYRYPHTWDGCTKWGTCKCVAIWAYRKAGYDIAYVGDGTSDFCPASKADMVFARSHLVEKCASERVPCHEFDDFHQVLAHVRARQESRVTEKWPCVSDDEVRAP